MFQLPLLLLLQNWESAAAVVTTMFSVLLLFLFPKSDGKISKSSDCWDSATAASTSLSLLRGQCSVLLRPGSNIFAPSSDDWDDDFVDLLLSGLRSLVPKTAWLYVFIPVKYMFWFELKTVKWCENTKNDRFWQIMFHGAVPESTALGLLDFPIIKVRFSGELLKS